MIEDLTYDEVLGLAKKIKISNWDQFHQNKDKYTGGIDELSLMCSCEWSEEGLPAKVSINVSTGYDTTKTIIGSIAHSDKPEVIELYRQIAESYEARTGPSIAEAREKGLEKARKLLG